MPEVTQCPQCARQLRVPDSLLGKMVKCPSCGTTFAAAAIASGADGPTSPEHLERSTPPAPFGASSQPSPLSPDSERGGLDDGGGFDDEADSDRPVRRDSQIAKDRVAAPAIALLIIGILDLALALCSGVFSFLNVMGVNVVNVAPPGQLPGQPGAEANAQLDAFIKSAYGVNGVISAILWEITAIITIVAALRMKRLRSRGLVMTAAILNLIPCFSCCITGIPIGIWVLVVISNQEVKDSFLS